MNGLQLRYVAAWSQTRTWFSPRYSYFYNWMTPSTPSRESYSVLETQYTLSTHQTDDGIVVLSNSGLDALPAAPEMHNPQPENLLWM